MLNALPIFSALQIKEIDSYTIESEDILSIDLMERASLKCTHWLMKHFSKTHTFKIFCGLGNNGGDGLAIARLLLDQGYTINAYLLHYSSSISDNCLTNYNRLFSLHPDSVTELYSKEQFPSIDTSDIIIDAIFGIGLSKPLPDLISYVVNQINASKCQIVAIDVPTGLYIDQQTPITSSVINASTTLTFQSPKLAFMFSENNKFVGDGHIIDIDLKWPKALQDGNENYYLNPHWIKTLIKPRSKFSHKGTYGHSLLIAGGYGKMGAAQLSAKALLRSGAGLLSVCVPQCGYDIMQTSIPEAMVLTMGKDCIDINELNIDSYSSIGIGPGIGVDPKTQQSVKQILANSLQPIVIDADALNCLSLNKEWLSLLPKKSILTPHPKEFERLTKCATNDFERHQLQVEFSKHHYVYVILKGAHTCITTPEGYSYFNSTGNSGLAKGGSGDALTGLLTGLLAQGYNALHACLIAVFIHGLAGDISKLKLGEIGMLPSDVIENIPQAFMDLIIL